MIRLRKYKELIKAIALVGLILISFFLTTRIWFYTSIEGIFVMSTNSAKTASRVTDFTTLELMKPEKIIVNYRSNHYLIKGDRTGYNEVLKLCNNVIQQTLGNAKRDSVKLTLDSWDAIRKGKNIEMKYPFSINSQVFNDVLGLPSSSIEKGLSIDAVIISPEDKTFYIMDEKKQIVLQYSIPSSNSKLVEIIDSEQKISGNAYVFLHDFEANLYGINVGVQARLEPKDIPTLIVDKESRPDGRISEYVSSFFSDENAVISILKDPDGTLVYTDREENGLRIDNNGLLEYVNYNVMAKSQKSITTLDALKQAADFVNVHLGFPNDSYISYLGEVVAGNEYIVKYNYRYNGITVLQDLADEKDALTLDILGDKTKNYKRVVRQIVEIQPAQNIKSFVEILDVLFDTKNTASNGFNITKINDMKLSYLERSSQGKMYLVPVWVIDVQMEKNIEGKAQKEARQYKINAETGVILDK